MTAHPTTPFQFNVPSGSICCFEQSIIIIIIIIDSSGATGKENPPVQREGAAGTAPNVNPVYMRQDTKQKRQGEKTNTARTEGGRGTKQQGMKRLDKLRHASKPEHVESRHVKLSH